MSDLEKILVYYKLESFYNELISETMFESSMIDAYKERVNHYKELRMNINHEMSLQAIKMYDECHKNDIEILY